MSKQLQALLKSVDQATRPFKSLQNESARLTASIRDTQTSMKMLQAQAASIDGFRKTSAQLAATQRQLKAAKAEAAALALQFKNSASPTAQQANAFDKARQKASQLEDQTLSLRQSVQQQRAALNDAGISTKKLSDEQQRLKNNSAQAGANLAQQKQALQRVEQQQDRLNRIKTRGQKGQALARKVSNGVGAVVAGGRAAVETHQKLIAPGMAFTAQLADTQSLLHVGKNDPQLAALGQQAKEVAAASGVAPTEVARTQSMLARAGYDADAILAATEPTINLQIAAALDSAEAADIVTRLQGAFDIPLADAERVADVMTAGTAQSTTSLRALNEAMKAVAPVAHAAGATLEETTAVLGVMADNQLTGAAAGSSGSAIFSRLQAPDAQASAALQALGVKTHDDDGNMLPILSILKSIDRAFKSRDIDAEQQAGYAKSLFGADAAAGSLSVINAAGNGSLAEKQGRLANAKGATASLAGVQTDTLAGDINKLSSAWDGLKIDLFTPQEAALRTLTETASGWVQTVRQWLQENPALADWAGKITGVLTLLNSGLGGMGMDAGTAVGGIMTLINGARLLGPVFSAVGGAIVTALGTLTWPVVALVAALVAGALIIRKYWEPISAFISGVAEGFTAAMGPISESFGTLTPVFSELSEKIKALWDWFSKLLEPVKSTQAELDSAGEMGKKFGNMLAEALKIPTTALNQLRGGIDWVLGKLGIIDTKSSDLKDKVPSSDVASSDGAPYLLPNTGVPYRPMVTPAAAMGYHDQSQNSYQYDIHMLPGMTREDVVAMIRQHQENERRNQQTSARSNMYLRG
jgi:TP901 family phage tail tape measure protein